MFLTFFVAGSLIMMSLGSNIILKYFEDRPQINAFFKLGASQRDIDALKEKLIETGAVSNIKFISQEQALQIFKERNSDNPLLTEFVTAQTLPSSFQISTKNLGDQDKVATFLEKEQSQGGIVDNVVFQKDVVQKLISLTKAVRSIGLATVLFLIITSILVTLIVISLNISLHQEEIETMRLVGATEWYIRAPFIFEGVFYGFAAAIFATIFVWLITYFLTPFLQEFLSDTPIFPINQIVFLYLFIAEALAGILVGASGSLAATRKYLKV